MAVVDAGTIKVFAPETSAGEIFIRPESHSSTYWESWASLRLRLWLFFLLFLNVDNTIDIVKARDSPGDSNTSICKAQWTAKWNKLEAKMRVLNQMELSRAENLSSWNGEHAHDIYEPEWVCDSLKGVDAEVVTRDVRTQFVCSLDNIPRRQACLVYSIGSASGLEFEAGVHAQAPNCEIHVFDEGVDFAQRVLPSSFQLINVQFHRLNIETKLGDDKSANLSKTVEEVMHQHNHTRRALDIVKIDCLGCEYTLVPYLAGMVVDGLVEIGQIHVEVHGTDAIKLRALFQSLREAGFIIFHKQTNLQGCPAERCVSYALVTVPIAFEDFKASHCPTEPFAAPIGNPRPMTDTPVRKASTPLLSEDVKTRFEKRCTVWMDNPLLLDEAGEGGVVFSFGLGKGGLGNKLAALRYNFFISLLLRKKLFVVSVDGVDISMYFKPHLYDWRLPPTFNSSIDNMSCFSCADLAGNKWSTTSLPQFISFHGCSYSRRFSLCNIGGFLGKRHTTLPAGIRNGILELWKSRQCFLRSMLIVAEDVYSFLPTHFLAAKRRIGLHVRWGDFYLKSVQVDSAFRHSKDKRVNKGMVKSCLKQLCELSSLDKNTKIRSSVYLYMATDMPQKLHSVYQEFHRTTNASYLSCSSNAHLLSNSDAYHTGMKTSMTTVDRAFSLAIADFVALSQSDKIVAPAYSTFSDEAAMFGLVKLRASC